MPLALIPIIAGIWAFAKNGMTIMFFLIFFSISSIFGWYAGIIEVSWNQERFTQVLSGAWDLGQERSQLIKEEVVENRDVIKKIASPKKDSQDFFSEEW